MIVHDRSTAAAARAKTRRDSYDAVVVGSGPNGLSAALAIAREGLSVLVVEAAPTIGGGTRSDVIDGCVRDICSTVHPAACVSPWFGSLDLGARGVTWIRPPAAVAHPLPDGTAAVLEPSFRAMEATLGADYRAWRALMRPFADRACDLFEEMGPVHVPRRPLLVARFGVSALHSAERLARERFADERARALFAGCAAHSMQPLDGAGTAAFGIVFGALGHAVGWPFVEGGSQRIADALAALLRAHGGEIETNRRVTSIDELPHARAILLDLAPATVSRVAAQHLPHDFRHELDGYLHGP
jgi:phytoene dehydrogenase-like protein